MGGSTDRDRARARAKARLAMLVGLLACSLLAWAAVGWVAHWLMTL